MAEVTSYTPGTPSWVELATSDPEGARAFYGQLLGWTFTVGGPEMDHYTMCEMRGKMVAGMGGRPKPDEVPVSWTTYLDTADVDGSVKRISDNGGQVMMAPMDVMSFGRMAIVADPTGAVFGLWQAGDHTGAQLVNESGSVVWNELTTRDLPAAQRFYAAVADYTYEPVDMGPDTLPYQMIQVQGRTVGGAMQMDEQFPPEIPSHWMTYFAVDDPDQAAAAAERLGGVISVPPVDAPYGRFSVLRDPQGGVFTVIRMAASQP